MHTCWCIFIVMSDSKTQMSNWFKLQFENVFENWFEKEKEKILSPLSLLSRFGLLAHSRAPSFSLPGPRPSRPASSYPPLSPADRSGPPVSTSFSNRSLLSCAGGSNRQRAPLPTFSPTPPAPRPFLRSTHA